MIHLTPLVPISIALIAGLGLVAEPATAQRYFDAKVIAVIDGDTIEVLVGRTPTRIRLSAIDTPERGQPWFRRAKRALSDRVFGKEVRINAVDTDAYGRTVGEVYAEDVCVQCELVRDGHAWVYRKYSDDPVLLELEAEARKERRGLWGLPEADRLPPWEWRHGGSKGGSRPSAPSRIKARDFTCGEKRYCREMVSCEEAYFHLAECDLDRLDGDGDGVPCEAICD